VKLLSIKQVADIQGVSVNLIKWYYQDGSSSKKDKKLKYHKARGGRVKIGKDTYNLHGELKKCRVVFLKSDVEEWQKRLLE